MTHRVTSDEKLRKLSTILFTVLCSDQYPLLIGMKGTLSSKISPKASTLIFLLRSPAATAVVLCSFVQPVSSCKELSLTLLPNFALESSSLEPETHQQDRTMEKGGTRHKVDVICEHHPRPFYIGY